MKHRLFTAIDLPDDIKIQVGALQNQLEKLDLPVTWQKIDKLHLTLNFLGEVHHARFQPVTSKVEEVVREFTPFTLSPMYLETMYKRHEPSLIYLGLAGELDILKDLQKKLSQGFNDVSIPQPIRYLPHITLGKLKRIDPTTTKRCLDIVSDFEYRPLPDFTVQAVTIFKSFVSREGSHYEKFRVFPLT